MRLSIALLLAAGAALAEEPAGLAETTAQLQAALGADAPADAQKALSTIPALYAKGTEEQQKGALEAVGKAAHSDDLTVRHGAFAALGLIKAKGSSKYLGRWLNPPNSFKGEIPISYTEAIRAAGAIADPSTLAALQDLSNHNDITIAEAATVALGGFNDLPTKRRKALAIDLVTRLEQLSTQPRRRTSEEVYERRAKLAAATTSALRGLTGKDYQTLKGWQTWRDEAEKKANPFDS